MTIYTATFKIFSFQQGEGPPLELPMITCNKAFTHQRWWHHLEMCKPLWKNISSFLAGHALHGCDIVATCVME